MSEETAAAIPVQTILSTNEPATEHDGTGENLEFARIRCRFFKPYYAAMVEMVQRPAELTRLRMP